MIEATWSKRYQVAPTRLLDASGNEIPLVTGRTFFQIVPIGHEGDRRASEPPGVRTRTRDRLAAP